MDIARVHRDWIGVFKELLKRPKENLAKITEIVHSSRRFLSLMTAGEDSATYTSYSEKIRESVSEILKALIKNIEKREAQKGIYEILDSCRTVREYDYGRILDFYVESAPTSYLVWAVGHVAERWEIGEEEERRVLKKSAVIGQGADSVVGEGAIRIVQTIYEKATKNQKEAVCLLSKLFRMRYIDLYVSKVYPALLKNEASGFATGLVEKVAEVEGFPVLSVAQHMRAEDFKNLPEKTVLEIRRRIKEEKHEQEGIAGLGVLRNNPELFTVEEILGAFSRTDRKQEGLLYNRGVFLVNLLESRVREVTGGGDGGDDGRGGDRDDRDAGNIDTPPCNAENAEEDVDSCSISLTQDARESINTFIRSLQHGTDGTRIQLCRICYILRQDEHKETLLALLSNKNIRVKWNALRSLTKYTLTGTEMEKIAEISKKTTNSKIRHWAEKSLKISEQAGR